MKTSIIITGQRTSVNALVRSFYEQAKEKYNYWEIEYPTKAEATKALSKVRELLKSDLEDWKKSNAQYYRGEFLSYDAATARLYQE